MKGFFAFILDVISFINIQKIIKPLYILTTDNEEIDMSRAKNFVKSTSIKSDFIIIVETISLELIKTYKGYVSYFN